MAKLLREVCLMSKSLDEVKKHISRKYLGKAGIHGVGISHSQNAVRVYMQPDADDAQEDLLKEIEKEAAPFKVLPVRSDRPLIS
jgi:hypothetical protein